MNGNAHLKKYTVDTGGQDMPDQDDGHELPRLTGEAYSPYARPSNKPVFALHLIHADGRVDSLQYYQLDSGSTYEPGKIKLRFIGLKVLEVEIAGRNLWELYDYLHSHRMPWIMEPTRDFGGGDGKPAVLKISVRDAAPNLENSSE